MAFVVEMVAGEPGHEAVSVLLLQRLGLGADFATGPESRLATSRYKP
jgi:hypothetical protein